MPVSAEAGGQSAQVLHLDPRVERARRGDASAFRALYEEHVGRIYALCLRLVRDPSRAETLTQDAFVHAWQKLSGFGGRSAFGTWLHRVATTVVLQELRADQRRRDREDAAGSTRLGTEEPVEGANAGMDLERAIAGLPERARTVFVLHDIEGYRHDEIAELMGSAVGTSKAQLHRARKLLREALQ